MSSATLVPGGFLAVKYHDSPGEWHCRLLVQWVIGDQWIMHTPDASTGLEALSSFLDWRSGGVQRSFPARTTPIHDFNGTDRVVPSIGRFLEIQLEYAGSAALIASGKSASNAAACTWWAVEHAQGVGVRGVRMTSGDVAIGCLGVHRRSNGKTQFIRYGERNVAATELGDCGASVGGSTVTGFGRLPRGAAPCSSSREVGCQTDADVGPVSVSDDVLKSLILRAEGCVALGSDKTDRLHRLVSVVSQIVELSPQLGDELKGVGYQNGVFTDDADPTVVLERVKSFRGRNFEKSIVKEVRLLTTGRQFGDGRQLMLTDAVAAMSETVRSSWPIDGPRTSFWCSKMIADNFGSWNSRHSRFVGDARLQEDDMFVVEHQNICATFNLATAYDLLNTAELSCFELLARRLQSIEGLYREKLPGAGSAGRGNDYFYFSGLGAGARGGMVLHPQLELHVARHQKTENTNSEARRKVAEERSVVGNKNHSSKGKKAGE